MHGLIFAAGLGTRLRPLTNDRPKALVEVAGVPMLDRVAQSLVAAGCTRLVVNVHHFADRMHEHLEARDYGVPVHVSEEQPQPLETGGGLWHARGLLQGAGLLLIHNVDVWTDLPLEELVAAHRRGRALCTLAVADRDTTRKLRFDDTGLLGLVDSKGRRSDVRPSHGEVFERGFNGVHVVEERVLERIAERGRFSIFAPYMRLCSEGEVFAPFSMDAWRWSDIGSPARLAALQDDLAR